MSTQREQRDKDLRATVGNLRPEKVIDLLLAFDGICREQEPYLVEMVSAIAILQWQFNVETTLEYIQHRNKEIMANIFASRVEPKGEA